MLSNSDTGYGLVSKVLHWAIAAMILALIAVGAYMADLDKDDPTHLQIFALHKAFGVSVLALVVARLAWMRYSPAPPPPAGLRPWERNLSRIVKPVLYSLMLLVPVAGYIMSNAGGKPISWFGLFDMPAIVGQSKALGGFAHEMHELLAYTLLALAALHVAGALKHRLVDKRPDVDVLRRML